MQVTGFLPAEIAVAFARTEVKQTAGIVEIPEMAEGLKYFFYMLFQRTH